MGLHCDLLGHGDSVKTGKLQQPLKGFEKALLCMAEEPEESAFALFLQFA